jgi:hypothetical protein
LPVRLAMARRSYAQRHLYGAQAASGAHAARAASRLNRAALRPAGIQYS